jgi:hypothetical protein
MTPEEAAKAAAWRACSLPRIVTSTDEYERLFAEKRYGDKDRHIAADLRAWIEGRAAGILLSDQLRDVDRGRKRNMLLAAGTRAALSYLRENRQPIDCLLITGLAALCIGEGGRCEVSLRRLCAMFRRKRDVMTDAMKRIRENCRDLDVRVRPGGSYSVAVRLMPADLYWTAFDLLSVFAQAGAAVVERASGSANPPGNPRGYLPEISGECGKLALNDPPEKPQGTLRSIPEGASGKPPIYSPEKSGTTYRNSNRPIGSTAAVDAGVAVDGGEPANSAPPVQCSADPSDKREGSLINGEPNGSPQKFAATRADTIQFSLGLGDVCFDGEHLTLTKEWFDRICREHPEFAERPDILKNAARKCDQKAPTANLKKRRIPSPLAWFENEWLSRALTEAKTAVAKVNGAKSRSEFSGARRGAPSGINPDNFPMEDPEP